MSNEPINPSDRDGGSRPTAKPGKTAASERKTNAVAGNTGSGEASTDHEPPELMRFKECARDGSVSVKTITRWVEQGYLTEWRPHPMSRTRRIIRSVWTSFKKRDRARWD